MNRRFAALLHDYFAVIWKIRGKSVENSKNANAPEGCRAATAERKFRGPFIAVMKKNSTVPLRLTVFIHVGPSIQIGV
jgi:hypothetical protein